MAAFEKQLTAKESSTCVVYGESNFKAVTTLWGNAVYFIEGNAKFQEEPQHESWKYSAKYGSPMTCYSPVSASIRFTSAHCLAQCLAVIS